jgi:rubrerythrin
MRGRQKGNAMSSSVIKLLQTCAAIERECAGLYHWLSDLFHDDRTVSTLWKKTALEEENHESQFLLAVKLVDGILAVPLIDLVTVIAELERLKKLRQEFEENPPDLVRALETAIVIEEELDGFHLQKILLFSNEDHRKMFGAMMAHDRDHAESLKRFFAELTGAPKVDE